jgi:hypothetical protein
MSNRAMIEHRVCIDLPGEPVECWVETDVTVLLRKHRDVIFDLHIKPGSTYTVEATEDWIYDVAKKKRIKQGQFSDGQRYHIWISRDFKGYLLLKQDGKELQRYSMFQLRLTSGDSDPKFKPDPIIIAMGRNAANSLPAGVESRAAGLGPSQVVGPAALSGFGGAPVLDHSALLRTQQWFPLPIELSPETTVAPPQVAHVVEVEKRSIPQEVLDQVAAGGADETAIDTNKIATRNWLLGQLAGAAAFLNDNKQWITELWAERFRLMKIVHKNAGERWYVVFTGNPRLRKVITAAKYGVKHEKVLTIAGGAGAVKSGAAAAWEGSKGAFKKAGLIALVFTITLDTAEWLHDYEQVGPDGKHKRDFADLLGKIGIDLAKAGLSAAIASLVVGALVTAATVIAGLSVPVIGIVIGTIFVAGGVGYALDMVDKETHATDHLVAWFRAIGEKLRSSAEYLEKSMPKDYKGYPLMYTP